MAGVVTQDYKERNGIAEITFNITADAATGTVPDTPTERPIAGDLIKVTTNPGATAPTALYDITLEDEDGVDVMGGALADRAAASSEVAYPKDPAGAVITTGVPVCDGLTLKTTNNAVHSALIKVRLTIRRKR